jgi:hypothetical protein
VTPRLSVSAPPRRRIRLVRRIRCERAQATVELVALLPLVAAVGLAAFTAVAAQSAGEQAGQAAEAGAVALLRDGDPVAAARAALPAAARHRTTIEVRDRRVSVTVQPAVPLLAGALAARVRADAGPEIAP